MLRRKGDVRVEWRLEKWTISHKIPSSGRERKGGIKREEAAL